MKKTVSQNTKIVRDRGVSDALMFLLALTIGLSVTFGVILFGVTNLSGVTDDQSQKVSEDDVVELQSDFTALSNNAPYQATEVQLVDSAIEYGDESESQIFVRASGSGKVVEMDISLQPLLIDTGNGAVVYEGGSVVYEKDGSSIISEPAFTIRKNRTILTIFDTVHDGGPAQLSGSDRTVTIVGYRAAQQTEFLDPTDSGTNKKATVEIVVTSPRYRAWSNYFEQHELITVNSIDEDKGEVTATFETYEVLIQNIETSVRYDT